MGGVGDNGKHIRVPIDIYICDMGDPLRKLLPLLQLDVQLVV